YTILFRDTLNYGAQTAEIISREVHWTRVTHVADNLKMSPIYGVPRMQQVWNRLYDLRKIYSSSGEAYWKGAFPGLAFETRPEVEDQGPLPDEDVKKLKESILDYQSGQQKSLILAGMSVKTLPPGIVAPGP